MPAANQVQQTLVQNRSQSDFNDYTAQKTIRAVRISTNVGKLENPEVLLKEMAAFIDVYDLRKLFKNIPNAEEMNPAQLIQEAKTQDTQAYSRVKKCVEIFHQKFSVDLEHGKPFLDNQVELEGGTDANQYNKIGTNIKSISESHFVPLIQVYDQPMLLWSVNHFLQRIADEKNAEFTTTMLEGVLGMAAGAANEQQAQSGEGAAPDKDNLLAEEHRMAPQLADGTIKPDEDGTSFGMGLESEPGSLSKGGR